MISLSACLAQDATSTGRASSAPSRIAYPCSTASGSSRIRSHQSAGLPTVAGSATAIRPRGAPRSVNTYSRPSRPARTPVCASTPSCTTRSSGAAGSDDRQVGQPQVVARRRAPGGGQEKPAPVPADRGAVVVRLVPALAEDEHVLARRACRPDAGTPAGDTGSPRQAPKRAAAAACSRTPSRPAASPRWSTGTGRWARPPARRSPTSSTRSRDSSSPPADSW